MKESTKKKSFEEFKPIWKKTMIKRHKNREKYKVYLDTDTIDWSKTVANLRKACKNFKNEQMCTNCPNCAHFVEKTKEMKEYSENVLREDYQGENYEGIF